MANPANLTPSKCLSKLIKWINGIFSKRVHRIFFPFSLLISSIFSSMKSLPEVAPGLFVIQIQIQVVCYKIACLCKLPTGAALPKSLYVIHMVSHFSETECGIWAVFWQVDSTENGTNKLKHTFHC